MNKQFLRLIMASFIIATFFTGCLVERRPVNASKLARQERRYNRHHPKVHVIQVDPNHPAARY